MEHQPMAEPSGKSIDRRASRRLRNIAGLALAACFACGSVQAETDAMTVAARLFPTSAAYPAFADQPEVSAAQLQELRPHLLAAAHSTVWAGRLDQDECSFLSRALESYPQGFRWVDWNLDGRDDVVYSGSAQCAEGNQSVVWLADAEGSGYQVDSAWSSLLLRFSTTDKRVVTVEVGCCGAPTDVYTVGDLTYWRSQDAVRVLPDTQWPPGDASREYRFRSRQNFKLRSSPEHLDDYDEGRSEFLAHASFGNVVRTYMAGAEGVVVAESKHGGTRWWFVVVDQAEDRHSLQNPYQGVRAGWVEAKHLRPLPAEAAE